MTAVGVAAANLLANPSGALNGMASGTVCNSSACFCSACDPLLTLPPRVMTLAQARLLLPQLLQLQSPYPTHSSRCVLHSLPAS